MTMKYSNSMYIISCTKIYKQLMYIHLILEFLYVLEKSWYFTLQNTIQKWSRLMLKQYNQNWVELKIKTLILDKPNR